jgi:hypothetical protein
MSVKHAMKNQRPRAIESSGRRAITLICTFACLVYSGSTVAASRYVGRVSATAADFSTLYDNFPFHSRSNPWTANHPDPSDGFATSQGVSAFDNDGSGLAVHAYAVLDPGIYSVQSIATAAVEFTLQTTGIFVPSVDVTLVGEYFKGTFGRVSAKLWKGNPGRFLGPQQTLFSDMSADPAIGLWDATVTLDTWTTYTLELSATANAISGFNLFSRAFIDPVMTIDSGPGDPEVVIAFEAGATGVNGDFVPLPASVPLPAGLPLLVSGLAALFGHSLRNARRCRAWRLLRPGRRYLDRATTA